ncbi:glycosyltransferase family 2 protein [Heliobacterium chlorum]|uniref:Glucosyl-3-phosphoglycerate synthase n=1 Tax=Heliobacterium chlorum TaxID=2698 RepID=A0ABR7T038_HELCL|nr:glycosyltransferase family 2 protein [Heliobacterium chlorum]MBC9783457.1 glycosyltransferase family 2 protein [Heliobacterium chlorum]
MSVSVIIPAYNEERTITDVVRAVMASPYADDVIVVSDGSEDHTAFLARQAGAQVIELPDNRGKGAAMQAGGKVARFPTFLFLDADLIGLTPTHLRSLAQPVLDDQADMTVGIFEQGRFATDLAQLVSPYLSGQRALKRDVFTAISELEASRYGVEVMLTRFFRNNEHLRQQEVILTDLTHLMKEEKLGFVKGFKARLKMYWEIGTVYLERPTRIGRDDRPDS